MMTETLQCAEIWLGKPALELVLPINLFWGAGLDHSY